MLEIHRHVTACPEQMDIIIEGMRNPMNSWDKSDSYATHIEDVETHECADFEFFLGDADQSLMEKLANGGPVHAKYRRMMPVWVSLTAPLYWWKEFDTYKVGTVANSCSTMHKIHAKEFSIDDFSFEKIGYLSVPTVNKIIEDLNLWRTAFTKYDEMSEDFKRRYTKKECWENMIQLLPSSYNQRRTVLVNYEVLHNIYVWRKNHKLTEWHTFCNWIKTLPYSELITMEDVHEN